MFNLTKIAALALAIAAVQPTLVAAQTVTSFNMTGSMPDNGVYGNTLQFTPTNPASSLRLQVTGWQINQSTNAITSAWVGAYSPGTGVTGIGDNNGNNGYHQIDNAGGYTDFLLLQFNQAVTLSTLTLNSFTLGSMSGKDNDLAFYAANFPEANWNSPLNLSAYTVPASLWTTVPGTGGDGTVSTGATITSREWLVAAAFGSGNNDGFKIAGLSVVSPVPEPASWAMMIMGFGLVGASMRRRPASRPVRVFALVKA